MIRSLRHDIREDEGGGNIRGSFKNADQCPLLLFSGLTGDVHPSHCDAEYAKQTRFKKPIAHGLLLAGMNALGASTARDRLDGLVMVEQSCRYLKPAVVGDTIKPRFVLEDIFQEGKRTHFRFKVRLLSQREETLLEGYHVYRLVTGEKRVRNP